MKISIIIPTYQRQDGKTPYFLSRALTSILEQKYEDYFVILIGDQYENDKEYKELSKIIPDSKIYTENLKHAKERSIYPSGSIQLWCAGGVNATNYGINISLSKGIHWSCRLDHDDWWETNHLELINDAIENKTSENTVFVASKSTYLKERILPAGQKYGINYFPCGGNLIHSSTCAKWGDIPLKFRDVFVEEGRFHPADADMWERLTEYMLTNKKSGYLIDEVTCHHDDERH